MRWLRIAAIGLALGLAMPARAEVTIAIDKSQQAMAVAINGTPTYHWTVSTGSPGRDTPNGRFTAQRLAKVYYSKKFDDAPMPNSVFFYEGYAIHGTYQEGQLGRPVSHGCVRLTRDNAATLYALVSAHGLSNTRVVVSGEIPDDSSRQMSMASERPVIKVADGPPPQRPDNRDAEPQRDPRDQPKYDPRNDPRFDPRLSPLNDRRSEPRHDPRSEPRHDPRSEPRRDARDAPRYAPPRRDARDALRRPPPRQLRTEPRYDPRERDRYDRSRSSRYEPRRDMRQTLRREDMRDDRREPPRYRSRPPQYDPRDDRRPDPRYEARRPQRDAGRYEPRRDMAPPRDRLELLREYERNARRQAEIERELGSRRPMPEPPREPRPRPRERYSEAQGFRW